MSQEGEGVTETPIVLKGLRSGWVGTSQNEKNCQNNEFQPKTWSRQIS